jgi:hypothetical protein
MSKVLTDRLANLLLLAGVIVAMLVLGEVSLRMFLPQPTYSRLLSQLGSYYAPSDYNTFTLQKNYVGTQPSMESSEQVRTTTNSLGLTISCGPAAMSRRRSDGSNSPVCLAMT